MIRGKFCIWALMVGGVVMLWAEAHAFPNFIPTVPTSLRCATCHVNPNGGGARNLFGQSYETAVVDGRGSWSDICGLDADEDGFTNGQELLDPDCMWSAGDSTPAGEQSNPSDANDVPAPPPEPDMGVVEVDMGMAPVEDAAVVPDMAANEPDEGVEPMGGSMPGGEMPPEGGTGGMGTGGTASGGTAAGGSMSAASTDDDDGGCAINSDRGLPSGGLLFGLLLLGLYRRRR